MEQALMKYRWYFNFTSMYFAGLWKLKKNTEENKVVKILFEKNNIYPPLQKGKQIVTKTYGPYLNGVWHNEDERMRLKQQIQHICLHLPEIVKSLVCTGTKSHLQSKARTCTCHPGFGGTVSIVLWWAGGPVWAEEIHKWTEARFNKN